MDKEIYIDSSFKEHVIADMPTIMIYYTVVKYGKESLNKDGYNKIVERFDNIIKNANVIDSIKGLGGA